MYIYADNAATTKINPVAMDVMNKCMTEVYGNPSSLHSAGQKAAEVMQKAREDIAQVLGADFREIYFTSGGTEADNQAIYSAAAFGEKKGKKHIISSAIEHHAVLHTLQRLEKEGFEITLLDVGEDGIVRPEDVRQAIREDTALVTIMYANNEIGSILPIPEIGKVCHEKGVLFHTDAVQAAGKLPLYGARWQVDAMSVSAHKLHGPKGCGALYLRQGARILPRQVGGLQERSLRGGTEAAPLIAAFGAAAEALPPLAEQEALFETLRKRLFDRLADAPVVFHLPADGVPYIIHLSVPGFKSETLLHFLSERDIFVSSGSACAKGAKSPVLQAMGLPETEIDSALRISLCHNNTPEDIDRFADALIAATQTLARRR